MWINPILLPLEDFGWFIVFSNQYGLANESMCAKIKSMSNCLTGAENYYLTWHLSSPWLCYCKRLKFPKGHQRYKDRPILFSMGLGSLSQNDLARRARIVKGRLVFTKVVLLMLKNLDDIDLVHITINNHRICSLTLILHLNVADAI